jgi:hypothetical protein
MIGADLGARGAPTVGLATSWPSAAATAGIHGQATPEIAQKLLAGRQFRYREVDSGQSR